MRGRVLPARALDRAQIAAWAALAGRAVEANPMHEPAMVLSAARHQANGAAIQLVVAEDGGEMHGAFPVVRVPRHGNIRVPVVTTNIRRMTYLGTPLVDREGGVDAAAAMLGALRVRSRHGDPGLLVVQWMGGDGPVSEWVRQAAARLSLPTFDYEDFQQPFLSRGLDGARGELTSKKHRKDYERRARRMAEDLGADLELVDRAGDPEAVAEFLTLEAAGYKTDLGVAMRTHPGEPEQFTAMCEELAQQGRLHVLALRARARTIAMQISLRAGDTLFLVKVGHDEALARYDPGVQLHLRAVEYFHQHTDAQAIRVCTFPDNALLLRLYPERRRTSTLVIGLGTAVDRMLVRALPAARTLSRGARQQVAAGAHHIRERAHGGRHHPAGESSAPGATMTERALGPRS